MRQDDDPDPALDHFEYALHNQYSSTIEGANLDSKRLRELEQLSGLNIDPTEREAMLADLVLLEDFMSRLPEITQQQTSGTIPAHQEEPAQVVVDLDQKVVRENSPAHVDGFFEIPPTSTSNGRKSR